jgi:VWFA-related protein
MMKKARIILVLGWLWLLSATFAIAQDDFVVRLVQADASSYPEITLYVGVTDAAGQPVGNLKRDDFSVIEDGKDVDIIAFAGVGDIRSVDIVFVFDTTTSMAGEVEGMRQTSIAFATKLEETSRDYRLGLVDFGDVINRVLKGDGTLTDNAEEFRNWIASIRLAGGGYDIPENSLGALQEATQMSFRDGTQKIFILITDAPPHHYGDPNDANVSFDDPTLNLEQTLQRLMETNVTVYIVAPQNGDFRRIVQETGGQFYNIHGKSDFTDIIDNIGTLISQQYRLTYVSPRPTYDGTRRDIRVTVGESTGTGEYLEKHLLNIRSNWLIGLILLTPLLLALALPPVLTRANYRRSGPEMAKVVDADFALVPPSQPAATPASICPHCGHPLRAGAKFCSGCGRTLAPMPIGSMTCPHCGNTLRPLAKFCSKCGQRLE